MAAMVARDFLRAQQATADLWPLRFLQALRQGLSPAEHEAWLPEFRRRFRNRVPDFAGAGLFATLLRTENMAAGDLADYLLAQVFLALCRNQPREDGAFVDYVRCCVRSAAVSLRRQSLDSVQRAIARHEEVSVVSLDEHPAVAESLTADLLDAADTTSARQVIRTVLERAEADGQRENVEIVLRSVLFDVALAEIARERGVSRQAMTKRYQRGVAYLRATQQEAFDLPANQAPRARAAVGA